LTPEAICERRWAGTLLQRVLDRLQTEWNKNHPEDHFGVLKNFLVAARGSTPVGEAATRLWGDDFRHYGHHPSAAPTLPRTLPSGDLRDRGRTRQCRIRNPASAHHSEPVGALEAAGKFRPSHEHGSSGRESAPSDFEGKVRADSRRLLRLTGSMRKTDFGEISPLGVPSASQKKSARFGMFRFCTQVEAILIMKRPRAPNSMRISRPSPATPVVRRIAWAAWRITFIWPSACRARLPSRTWWRR